MSRATVDPQPRQGIGESNQLRDTPQAFVDDWSHPGEGSKIHWAKPQHWAEITWVGPGLIKQEVLNRVMALGSE